MNYSLILLIALFELCYCFGSSDKNNCDDDNNASSWLERLQDPQYDCQSVLEEDSALFERPEVFSVVDCQEAGARWNYNYQTDAGKKSGKVFKGFSSITFSDDSHNNNKFRHGLKIGKCIKTFRPDVRLIKGVIKDDKLLGNVAVEFSDKTFASVHVKENRLSGILRHFSAKGELLNVTVASNGQLLWHRDHFGSFRFNYLRGSTRRLLVTDNFITAVDCEQHDSVHLVDCSEMAKLHAEDTTSSDCASAVSNLDFKKVSNEVFKFNAKTREKVPQHVQDNNLHCPEDTEWNGQEIRGSIVRWKRSILDNSDLLWHLNSSSEPLDLSNPRIQIVLDQWVGRQPGERVQVKIFGTDRLLLETLMENGKIEAQVPDKVARLPDWKAPVRVSLIRTKLAAKNTGFVTVEDAGPATEEAVFNATGRLHRGSFEGPVVMQGIVSNDPASCSQFVGPGLGFFGHFKSSRPHGVCWRELLGGGWIYGHVNDEGLFTGDDIAYIYPDIRTAIVGKFERGLLVKGQAAEVVGERCNELGVKVLKFSRSEGPFYHYSPATEETFGDEPLVGDPLDNRYIDVKVSEKYPLAGEGAFARHEVPPRTIYSLYGGKIYSEESYGEFKTQAMNEFRQRRLKIHQVTEFWKYKHRTPACDRIVYIPPEFESMAKFRGTIGHKVNHSFKPNSFYVQIDSPRFGVIVAVMSSRTISPGEEFFSHYGYQYDFSPAWYKEAFLQFMTDHPEEKVSIQTTGLGRTKEELEAVLENYLKLDLKNFVELDSSETTNGSTEFEES